MEYREDRGNIFTGLIGAVIGALIGAVAWVIVGKMGYIMSIVGLLIAFLASKGYDMLKGPQTNIKAVILIICVIAAVVAGNYVSVCWQIHDEYVEYSETYDMAALGYTEASFREEILADPEVQSSMYKDTGVGLLFAGLGCVGTIAQSVKTRKQREAAAQASAMAQQEPDDDE